MVNLFEELTFSFDVCLTFGECTSFADHCQGARFAPMIPASNVTGLPS